MNWYESSVIIEQMAPGSLNPTNFNDPQVISASNLCGTIYQLAPPPVTERTMEAGIAIMMLQGNSSSLSPEQEYLTRKYVHRKLQQHPQWLILGTPQDTMYQNFYSQTDSTNFGLFRVVEEYAVVENQQQVEGVNASVTCTGSMDHNLKVVTEIYARTWMENIFAFSSVDSSTLYSIATLNPSIEGPGVYTARALLGLNVDDVTGSASYRTNSESDQPKLGGAVYPNPAQTTVYISFSLNSEENTVVEIYDIHGRLVQQEKVVGATELIAIDVSDLDEGAYIVSIKVNGEVRMNEKLVIFK